MQTTSHRYNEAREFLKRVENDYLKAKSVIEQYDTFFKQGYTHLEDATKEMDGKRALLSGNHFSGFYFDDKEVELIYEKDVQRIGFKFKNKIVNPFDFEIPNNLFFKLVN